MGWLDGVGSVFTGVWNATLGRVFSPPAPPAPSAPSAPTMARDSSQLQHASNWEKNVMAPPTYKVQHADDDFPGGFPGGDFPVGNLTVPNGMLKGTPLGQPNSAQSPDFNRDVAVYFKTHRDVDVGGHTIHMLFPERMDGATIQARINELKQWASELPPHVRNNVNDVAISDSEFALDPLYRMVGYGPNHHSAALTFPGGNLVFYGDPKNFNREGFFHEAGHATGDHLSGALFGGVPNGWHQARQSEPQIDWVKQPNYAKTNDAEDWAVSWARFVTAKVDGNTQDLETMDRDFPNRTRIVSAVYQNQDVNYLDQATSLFKQVFNRPPRGEELEEYMAMHTAGASDEAIKAAMHKHIYKLSVF